MQRHWIILMLILALVVPGSLRGQNADTQTAIAALSSRLEQNFGISINLDPPPIEGRTWQRAGLGEQQNLLRFLALLAEEMEKHEPYLFRNIGPVQFGVMRYYRTVGGGVVTRAATFVPQRDMIYVDLDGLRHESWSRGMVHHELYHLLQHRYLGSNSFADPKWMALNPPRFRYGKGANALLSSVQGRQFSELSNPAPGFLTLYSMTALTEDQAEIFEAMHHPEHERVLRRFTREDPLLAAKVAYLERLKAFWSTDLSAEQGQNYLKLLRALHRRNGAEVRRLLTLKETDNPKEMVGPHGWSLVHAVAAYGYPITAIGLPDFNVHAIDTDGWTALHYAALGGPAENVEALLAAGADPDWADRSGRSPRKWSVLRGTMKEGDWRKLEADLARQRRDPAFEEAYAAQVARRQAVEAEWRAAATSPAAAALTDDAVDETGDRPRRRR